MWHLPRDARLAAGKLHPRRHHDRLLELPRRRPCRWQECNALVHDQRLRGLPRHVRLEAGDPGRSRTGARLVLDLPQRRERDRQADGTHRRPRRSAAAATARSRGSPRPASRTTGITGNCYSCHNGTSATGKNATHIPTSNTCEACHTPTAWKPATRVDHTQVIGTCFSCHNGTLATGKNATHIASDTRVRRMSHDHGVETGDPGRSCARRRRLQQLPQWREGGRKAGRSRADDAGMRFLPLHARVAAGQGRPQQDHRRLQELPRRHQRHRHRTPAT